MCNYVQCCVYISSITHNYERGEKNRIKKKTREKKIQSKVIRCSFINNFICMWI